MASRFNKQANLPGFIPMIDKDLEWKPAIAKITSENTIEVYHPDIPNPTRVRYAWSSNPAAARPTSMSS